MAYDDLPKAYYDLTLKVPVESEDYKECSDFVVVSVERIIGEAIGAGKNKIIINTNLKLGIPMENVNKIAGPFVEAWVFEVLQDVLEDEDNRYHLVNVEAGERLNMADVILQFEVVRKKKSSITGYVDVKATSRDIPNSGKSPNITSFARIRTAYVKDPDYIFVILSVKHTVLSTRDKNTGMMMGVMEVADFNAYDLKYIADTDLQYNPALGSGQIQIKDIHYVEQEQRSTWEFCQLLDRRCMLSIKGFDNWLRYATQNGWIK